MILKVPIFSIHFRLLSTAHFFIPCPDHFHVYFHFLCPHLCPIVHGNICVHAHVQFHVHVMSMFENWSRIFNGKVWTVCSLTGIPLYRYILIQQCCILILYSRVHVTTCNCITGILGMRSSHISEILVLLIMTGCRVQLLLVPFFRQRYWNG